MSALALRLRGRTCSFFGIVNAQLPFLRLATAAKAAPAKAPAKPAAAKGAAKPVAAKAGAKKAAAPSKTGKMCYTPAHSFLSAFGLRTPCISHPCLCLAITPHAHTHTHTHARAHTHTRTRTDAQPHTWHTQSRETWLRVRVSPLPPLLWGTYQICVCVCMCMCVESFCVCGWVPPRLRNSLMRA